MARFAVVVYGDIQKTSGGNYYDRMLIRALEARGHAVKVTTPESIKNRLKEKTPPGVDAYIIDELCHPDFWRGRDFSGFHEGTILIAMTHHLAAEEHLGSFVRFRHLFQERFFFKHIDYCICNSSATKEAARRIAGYKGPASVAVPGVTRPAQEKQIRDAQRENGKGRVLSVEKPIKLLSLGNLIPRKGIHHLIKCMAIEPRLPCSLEIAGNMETDPAYTGELRKLTAKLRLEEQVSFLGFVTESEKGRLLKEADFLIVPSDHEGYGIVYLEAMEYGTVPVGTRSGGAGEVIRHGSNGFLVPPHSPKSLYEILLQCIQNPAVYRRSSQSAVETWLRHPTWDLTFEEVLYELESFIQSGS